MIKDNVTYTGIIKAPDIKGFSRPYMRDVFKLLFSDAEKIEKENQSLNLKISDLEDTIKDYKELSVEHRKSIRALQNQNEVFENEMLIQFLKRKRYNND